MINNKNYSDKSSNKKCTISEESKKFSIFFYLLIFSITLLLLSSSTVFAQGKALSVAVGFTTPFGPSSGFTMNTLFGVDFDEAVFYGFGLDFTLGNWTIDSIENSFAYFPIYGALRIKFPFTLPFALYSIAAVGYSFMIDRVDLGVGGSESNFYGSFFWKLSIGVGLMLGSKTDGIFEIQVSSYNFQRWSDNINFPESMSFVTIGFYFGIRFFRM